jgi:hypothetical protein
MDKPLRVVADVTDDAEVELSLLVLLIPTCFEMCNPVDLKDVSVTFALTGARLPTFALIVLKSDDDAVTIVVYYIHISIYAHTAQGQHNRFDNDLPKVKKRLGVMILHLRGFLMEI